MQYLKILKRDVAVPRLRRGGIWAGLIVVVLLGAAGLIGRELLARQNPIHIAFVKSADNGQETDEVETLVGARMYLDEVNRDGGVNGRPIVLDQLENPGNETTIADGPALAVLGHCPGGAASAAGADSPAAHIPAVSDEPAVDDRTTANPYCFQAQARIGEQGQWLAHYIREVLLRDSQASPEDGRIDLVTANDGFGERFARGFTAAMGEQIPKTWTLDVEPGAIARASGRLADQLAQATEPRILVIGVAEVASAALVKAIRRRRLHSTIVLSAPGGDAYLANFEKEPEQRETPGFFTRDMYIATPMIFDAVGMLGHQFAESYTSATKRRPSWFSAGANDAVRIIVEALRRAALGNTVESKRADREAVRAGLASIDSPGHAVAGLDGPLYFDPGRDIPRPLRVGYYDRGRLVSAPLQLVPVPHPDLIDLMKGLGSGNIINIGPNFFWVQRVVYAGIDFAHLNYIDVQAGTFNADLYVWLRYGGDNADPTHIEFPDLARVVSPGGFDPARPTEQGEVGGLNYRLYRIAGDFKAGFDLHDYPFDTQFLVVRFQNHEQPRQQVAYVTDTFGLRMHRPDQTPPGSRSAFADLQLWHVSGLRYFVHSFSISSTEGKPAFFDSDSRNEYGGFDAAVVVRRDALAFMVKNLAPLFLLVSVVFATLFFPASLAAERTSIPVTGFLTSAVLLVSISNQLPTLGYTMALEYMFYIFFGLCLMTMCAGFVTERLRNQHCDDAAARLDQIARIAYGGVVTLTLGGFVWWFAPG